MYESFSTDYDRFVDWSGRLAVEMDFLMQQLEAAGARRVLDAACGTGMHAIALAERGYDVVGVDLSAGMIEQARANAATAGVAVRFEVAGFGALSTHVGGDFDAVLCLGNSLPHLLTPAALAAALEDFSACLQPEGLLLVQNRNFDAVLAQGARWMPPQSHQEGGAEWLFVRFYDFEPDGSLVFNVMTLHRTAGSTWEQHVATTRLWPLLERELVSALESAGFASITRWGDMSGAPFDSAKSPNLILVARKME